jgi:hypothetical protein
VGMKSVESASKQVLLKTGWLDMLQDSFSN